MSVSRTALPGTWEISTSSMAAFRTGGGIALLLEAVQLLLIKMIVSASLHARASSTEAPQGERISPVI